MAIGLVENANSCPDGYHYDFVLHQCVPFSDILGDYKGGGKPIFVRQSNWMSWALIGVIVVFGGIVAYKYWKKNYG